MADKKEKKYVSDNARLMSEWDFTQNDALKLDPHNLSINSNISAYHPFIICRYFPILRLYCTECISPTYLRLIANL